jgi:hypothetical protein
MEYLAYTADPVLLFVFAIVANIALFEIGRAVGKRFRLEDDPRRDAAFTVAETAIFGLAALILAFSFSFSSSRFEARRTLVTDEANAIGTAWLRAAYLPEIEAKRFRSMLAEYTRLRLLAYAYNPDLNVRLQAEKQSIGLQQQLWSIAVKAGRADPKNVQLGLLTQSLNETIDFSAVQAALLRNHLPSLVLNLVVAVSCLVSLLAGTTFGRARAAQPVTSILLCFAFAIVVFTIVDLDRPQRGFIRTNLAPLQTQLQAMLSS